MQEEIQRKITINIPISLYDKILQENGKNLTDKIISILTTYFKSNDLIQVSENKIEYDYTGVIDLESITPKLRLRGKYGLKKTGECAALRSN